MWLYGTRSILSWMDKPALVPWRDIKTAEVETELCIQSISDPSRRGMLTVNNDEERRDGGGHRCIFLQGTASWKKLNGHAAA